MKKQSRIVVPVHPSDSPQRHLPLVDLLVDTRTELFELAIRSGLKVLETMMEDDRTTICGPRRLHPGAENGLRQSVDFHPSSKNSEHFAALTSPTTTPRPGRKTSDHSSSPSTRKRSSCPSGCGRTRASATRVQSHTRSSVRLLRRECLAGY